MTTYPLSEPATIYSVDASGAATSNVLGQGSLEDCVSIVAGLSADKQKSISIKMNGLDLQFGPKETEELQNFLREESAGVSNNEIVEIRSSGS